MKEWKSTLTKVICGLSFLSLTPSIAQSQCQTDCCVQQCNPCCCTGGHYEAGLDYLYWKACAQNVDFAAIKKTHVDLNDGTVSNLKFQTLCPEYRSGFRAWLELPRFYCNWGIAGEFIFYGSKTSKTVKVDPNDDDIAILETFNEGELGALWGQTEGSYDLIYKSLDVLLTYQFDSCCGHHFKPFFGTTVLILEHNTKSHSEFPKSGTTLNPGEPLLSNTNSAETSYWGMGLKLGLDYKYNLCSGLSLIANGAGMIVTGHKGLEFDQELINASHQKFPWKFHDHRVYYTIPGFHLAVGAQYEMDFACRKIGARIGYEVTEWFRTLSDRRYNSNVYVAQAFASSATRRNLILHGMFAGLEVKF